MNKYRVTETFIKDGKKYYAGQILYKKPFECKKIELAHGYTAHSLQGSTFENDIYINYPCAVEKDHEKTFRGYMYTAISRAQTIE
jgi:hypothetical protein